MRLTLSALCAMLTTGCAMNILSREPQPLVPGTAFRYILAWGRVRTLPADEFHVIPGGDFQGRVRAANFQYTAKDHRLVVWGTVTPFAKYATYNPEILAGLDEIAAKDPGSTLGARFELARFPWQIPQIQEPGIYLRKEYTTDALSEGEFVQEVERLQNAAYRFGHGPLQQAVRESARRRLAQ